MQELIKVTTSEGGKQVVSAKELYSFLELEKAHWKRWTNKNIVKNVYAVENTDWQGFTIEVNGNQTQDFVITLDFAKRLAMMARTEKGEAAREYFLECERKAKEPKAISLPSMKELALMVIKVEEEKEVLQKTIEIQSQQLVVAGEKVKYVDEVLQSNSLIPTNVIAKELGMSAVKLNRILNQAKVIYKSGSTWVPYRKYEASGFTKTKTISYTDSNGNQQSTIHTYWTEEGRKFIHEQITA